MEKEIINRIKHIETFYEQAPPGYVKDEEERPEDCIPDEECNQEARDFLANAPTKGLWMPLGKEVKVMQCWRCKRYGHRTGDKECPLFKSGNAAIEKFREVYEDPMYHFVETSKREENEKKKLWLQQLLDKSTTSDSSGDENDSKKQKLTKKHKKSKKKTKKSKHKSRKHSCDTDSERESSNCERIKSKRPSHERKSSHASEKKSSKRRHKERDGHSSSKKKSKS